MKIAVIGGSGLVGAKLVSTLRHRRHEVVAASRRSGVNTLTGEGLAQAIAGCRVVVDVINSPMLNGKGVLDFFGTSSRNLLAAAESARVKHYLVLSIVGTDRLPESPYFQAKMLQEELARRSLVPHTILRSTQFFDFMRHIPVPAPDGTAVRVSPAFVQPVAADEVAAALADLATSEPRNGMIEHAGPDVFHLHEVVRRVMSVADDARAVIEDPRARYFGAELENDSLTPDEGAIIGVTRLDDWLKLHASALRAEGIPYHGSFGLGLHELDLLNRAPRAQGRANTLPLNR
jgi:uncharacterized protein YbjT (DUF2867 family)